MVKDKKAAQNRADVLFSEYIRQRDPVCQKCSSHAPLLHCAHYIGRVNKRLRYDEQNALSLCVKCHLEWSHKNPKEFTEWFKGKYPDRYEYLIKAKNEVVKLDYDVVVSELKEKINGKGK
ncbi:MAG: hypothetical protein NUV65_03555 [Candidatus Roizmanbacteria bacterium]|nr:hypothetical protein [Candidatus Roizmanbacteria bacterium]